VILLLSYSAAPDFHGFFQFFQSFLSSTLGIATFAAIFPLHLYLAAVDDPQHASGMVFTVLAWEYVVFSITTMVDRRDAQAIRTGQLLDLSNIFFFSALVMSGLKFMLSIYHRGTDTIFTVLFVTVLHFELLLFDSYVTTFYLPQLVAAVPGRRFRQFLATRVVGSCILHLTAILHLPSPLTVVFLFLMFETGTLLKVMKFSAMVGGF